LDRAFAAFFRAAAIQGEAVLNPPSTGSEVVDLGGKRYAVLRNANLRSADGILAVYRIRNDGVLKRLKRWPSGLEGRAGER
jgi:hypothetical protein